MLGNCAGLCAGSWPGCDSVGKCARECAEESVVRPASKADECTGGECIENVLKKTASSSFEKCRAASGKI